MTGRKWERRQSASAREMTVRKRSTYAGDVPSSYLGSRYDGQSQRYRRRWAIEVATGECTATTDKAGVTYRERLSYSQNESLNLNIQVSQYSEYRAPVSEAGDGTGALGERRGRSYGGEKRDNHSHRRMPISAHHRPSQYGVPLRLPSRRAYEYSSTHELPQAWQPLCIALMR